MLCHETQINYKKYITECTNSYRSSSCLQKVTCLSFSLVLYKAGTVTLKAVMSQMLTALPPYISILKPAIFLTS